MARHRDIRNLDYEEEYDEAYDDAVYGHSVDEHEYGLSPSTEQYLYSQKGNANYGFGAYFPGTEKIKEEEENFVDEPFDIGNNSRRDSSGSQRPRLSSEDEIKLNSVLDELRNVVGDQFSEAELVKSVLEHGYDFESSLNAILNKRSASSEKQEADTKSKREVFPLTSHTDGNTNILSSFDFLLPLSYSCSSAFCFEKGNFERICTKQIIKDWQISLNKTKSKNKIYDKKACVEDTDSLENDTRLNNSSWESPDIDKHSRKTQVIQNTNVTDNISLSNLLPDNASQMETIIKKIKVDNVEDSDSGDSGRDVPDLSSSPITLNERNPAKNFVFNIPSSSKIKKDPVFKFGSPTLITSPQLSFPSHEGKGKLASLAAAHLNLVGKSLPVCINKPLTSRLSGSPLEKKANLSALASAHLEKTSNKLGTLLPSFDSLRNKNKILSLDHKKRNGSLNGDAMNKTLTSLSKLQIPDSLHDSKNSTPSQPILSLNDLNYNGKSNDCSDENMEIPAEDQDDTSKIDLKQALLNKEERDRISCGNDDEKLLLNMRHVKILLSNRWSLTKEDCLYLATRPLSVFGKTMIVDKRKRLLRNLKRKIVSVPYLPFDFSSLSPDDYHKMRVKKIKNKNNNNDNNAE